MGFAASSSSDFSTTAGLGGRPWLSQLAQMAQVTQLAGWLQRRALSGWQPIRSRQPAEAAPSLRSGRAVRAAYVRPAHVRQPVAPTSTVTAAPRPLRVLRVVDGASRQCAGRMVISGRMADVCAELDRLAAREAQRAA